MLLLYSGLAQARPELMFSVLLSLDSQIQELLGLFAPDPAFSPSESIEQQNNNYLDMAYSGLSISLCKDAYCIATVMQIFV